MSLVLVFSLAIARAIDDRHSSGYNVDKRHMGGKILIINHHGKKMIIGGAPFRISLLHQGDD